MSVTFEDQQKINVYARKCNKLAELQEEIKTKKVGGQLFNYCLRVVFTKPYDVYYLVNPS